MLSVVSTIPWAGVSDCTHKNENANSSLQGSGNFAEEEGRQTVRVVGMEATTETVLQTQQDGCTYELVDTVATRTGPAQVQARCGLLAEKRWI